MSLAKSEVRYTVEEYLALERESEERHEYLDGLIYAMAGESPEHGEICTNLVGQLYNQLRDKPCRIRSKDTKVLSGPIPQSRHSTKGLYSYPDLLVVCGAMRFHDEYRDVLLNPQVIIEVLSPNTEAFDLGEKFRRYRTYIESLTDYVVVAQNQPVIEHFARQENGLWLIAAPVSDLEESLTLASIDCTLRLADVYDRVTFPEEAPDPTEEE
ncbi:MAG: Uma2 family endonuclease [Blastocatellia bacterium]|nr:Uma2 family endonuclease [Blastocatellia bacterium]